MMGYDAALLSSPFYVSKILSLPLSEGELKGVPAQRDAGGSYTLRAV